MFKAEIWKAAKSKAEIEWFKVQGAKRLAPGSLRYVLIRFGLCPQHSAPRPSLTSPSYQIVLTEYERMSGSGVTNRQFDVTAWAINNRSKGSRCNKGSTSR